MIKSSRSTKKRKVSQSISSYSTMGLSKAFLAIVCVRSSVNGTQVWQEPHQDELLQGSYNQGERDNNWVDNTKTILSVTQPSIENQLRYHEQHANDSSWTTSHLQLKESSSSISSSLGLDNYQQRQQEHQEPAQFFHHPTYQTTTTTTKSFFTFSVPRDLQRMSDSLRTQPLTRSSRHFYSDSYSINSKSGKSIGRSRPMVIINRGDSYWDDNNVDGTGIYCQSVNENDIFLGLDNQQLEMVIDDDDYDNNDDGDSDLDYSVDDYGSEEEEGEDDMTEEDDDQDLNTLRRNRWDKPIKSRHRQDMHHRLLRSYYSYYSSGKAGKGSKRGDFFDFVPLPIDSKAEKQTENLLELKCTYVSLQGEPPSPTPNQPKPTKPLEPSKPSKASGGSNGNTDNQPKPTEPIEPSKPTKPSKPTNPNKPSKPSGGSNGNTDTPTSYPVGEITCPEGCPDCDPESPLPCPPSNMKKVCDKHNDELYPKGDDRAGERVSNFADCYDMCKPSFCCIHDSKSKSYSPSCAQEYANCPIYYPCYIIWWKLHDTIGPATYLRVETKDEPFYENADFDTLQNDFAKDTEFFQQLFGHHFDGDDAPTDETFENKDNW